MAEPAASTGASAIPVPISGATGATGATERKSNPPTMAPAETRASASTAAGGALAERKSAAGGAIATANQQESQPPKDKGGKKGQEKDWRKEMYLEGVERRKKIAERLKEVKAGRQYLGWLDANNIEWRTYMEYMGWKKWKERFGPGTEWEKRYEKWICSGMTRGAMRKPSFRGLEWLRYQRGCETAPMGECCTRKKTSIRDYFIEPINNYCCRPTHWPRITSAEVGWLAKHESCQLEIYPNDFMKKPPLPWWQPKISSFLPGTW